MSAVGHPGGRWPALRYERLLPRAGASRRAGRAYARAVALYELAADPARRRVACARIERWCAVGSGAAVRIFTEALRSEAREEAESAWLMGDPSRLPEAFGDAAPQVPIAPGTVVATLHLGSPVLGFVHLSHRLGLVGRAIGRELDDANPMPPAKRRWGARKVAWVRGTTGEPFLGTDARALLAARDDLDRGRSVYAAVDVPGDVVSRSRPVEICGERVLMSTGLLTVARLARAPVQLVTTRLTGERYRHESHEPIEPGPEDAVARALGRQAGAILRRTPGEWWLWPYAVAVSRDASGDSSPRASTTHPAVGNESFQLRARTLPYCSPSDPVL